MAREAWYHNACRREYIRSDAKHVSHKDSEASKSIEAHQSAFDFLCVYIEKYIIKGQNVERLTMIRGRNIEYLLDKFSDVNNENYKTFKLKDKLVKYFQKRPESSKTTSGLVYSADVEGSAVEKAFELASSDERRLHESAMILRFRRYIIDACRNSRPIPWPPSSDWLLSEERKPPEILLNFIMHLISIKPEKRMSAKTNRIDNSISGDICYAASNGEWVMLKHILLPIKVRHLTGNAVTMLNRFGHTQSYTRTMQLETAMCSAVTASESTLPPNISPDKNSFLHLCWDNFDLNEETSSGSGITHSTHGIIIQEVADRSKIVSTESQLTKSRERTVKPKAIDIKSCYAKLKSEAKFQV